MLLSPSLNILNQIQEIRKCKTKKENEVAKKLLDSLTKEFSSNEDLLCLNQFCTGSSLSQDEEIELKDELLSKVPNVQLKLCNFNLYLKLLPLTKLIYSVEKNGSPQEHAYKLAVIFENEEKAFSYLMDFARKNKNSKNPVHDACIFALPQAEFDLQTWKKLWGKFFIKEDLFKKYILPQASEIESLIKASPQRKLSGAEIEIISKLTKRIDETNRKVKDLKKKHGALNEQQKQVHQELSKELLQLREELTNKPMPFNDQLNLTVLNAFREKIKLESDPSYKYFLEHGLTKNDYIKFTNLDRQDAGTQIPDIIIDGAALGYPGYYLKKINVRNEEEAARAACLGKLTDCCQSLSGENGEPCVIHGLTSPYGGFYIVCQGDLHNPKISDKLLGQCWAWRSQNNALVFDSIEISDKISDKDEELVTQFYRHLANKLVLEGHTDKVACGATSGISGKVGIPSQFNTKENFVDYAEKWYCDSRSQLVLCIRDKPFYLYGIDEEQSQATVKMIETALKDPRPLVELVGLRTALNWALRQGKEDLVQKIRDIAKNSNPSRFMEVELMVEAMKNFVNGHTTIDELVPAIEKNILFVNSLNRNGETPLLIASYESKDPSTILSLLSKGADINAQTLDHKTPLMCAIVYGDEEIAHTIIENGADLNVKDSVRTLLMLASARGYQKIVLELIEKGVDVNAKTDYTQQTALIIAAEYGHKEIVHTLIEHKADVHAQDSLSGYTPLIAAVKNGHKEIMSTLIKNGADLEVKDKCGVTALVSAIRDGNKFSNNAEHYKEIALELIENGANVNTRDSWEGGGTILMSAIRRDDKEIVHALIKNRADVNAQNSMQMTPLMIAALEQGEQGEQNEMVRSLIENKAEVNFKGCFGKTPLMCAVEKGHKETVCTLIKNRADVNAIDSLLGTIPLLMRALTSGYEEIAHTLIENGADFNAQNKAGETALMLADENGYYNLVEIMNKKNEEIGYVPPVSEPRPKRTPHNTYNLPTYNL